MRLFRRRRQSQQPASDALTFSQLQRQQEQQQLAKDSQPAEQESLMHDAVSRAHMS